MGWKSYTEQYLDSCDIFRDAVLSILATIAKKERVRLSECTVAGLERARKQGRIGGRPRVVTDRAKVAELRASGKPLGEIAMIRISGRRWRSIIWRSTFRDRRARNCVKKI